MMPTGDTGENCHTCGHSGEWHQENKPIHSFNDGKAGAAGFLKRSGSDKSDGPGHDGDGVRVSPWPIDPVLRTVLINKGVITPEDLRQAEEVIRATTAHFEQSVKGSRNGQ